MSGTSLDGIDVALIRTDGEALVERGPSHTYGYDAAFQAMLKQAIADAADMTGRAARPGSLAYAERWITERHATAVRAYCRDKSISISDIDVIGFHGQTVVHRPEIKLTVQLGDGRELAKALGRPVIHDLRAADVAAGGQGAPLVPVYHRALAAGLPERPIAFVNIGGVANVTWIGRDGELLAFDTGPGNALINDWCKARTGADYDEGGTLAAQGKVDHAALAQLMGHPYFEEPPPKSLDRNSFAGLQLDHLSDADGAATLLRFTADSIRHAVEWLPEGPQRWIVCGGGRKNLALMAALEPGFETSEHAGFDGDSMEAEAWGYLAVRSLKGLPITFPGTTRAPEPMSGGVLAEP
ncbi:anhydro-N-acetylmuramic acid kinase [Aestuariivirga sp.]|uniref:anhydro-N-acetylmuramic acid kinase n=1 Tax=Aestuariivirga sp. TaxID=2650926 RepID=UPI0039E61D4F